MDRLTLVVILVCVLVLYGCFKFEQHLRDQCEAQVTELREGWTPPAIQYVEGCALWDEIRHACEDD